MGSNCGNDSSGTFSCLTGDCGTSILECSGGDATAPVTLAEFKLGPDWTLVYYDVSLVDGYNLPLMISPHNETGGNCNSTGCAADLNGDCPSELEVVSGSETVACKSACTAFGAPQYCCDTTDTTNGSAAKRVENKTGCHKCNASGGTCGSDSNNRTICHCPSGFYNSPELKQCLGLAPLPGPVLAPTYSPRPGSAIVGILLIFAVCCFVPRFKRKLLSNYLHQIKMNDNARIEAFIIKFGSFAPKRYSYGEIKKMTNQFNDKLGQGGFGSVYKGKLPDGRLVAVKSLNETKSNGEDFMNEVASISRTSHVNIVTLLGFCFERSKRALIYEFMPKGSLDKFIYSQGTDNQSRQLEWKTLYDIALGIARGLEYLHQGCNTRILHFDIKPHNVLLDENFCPKISDFGLSKLCERKKSVVSMTGARGTAGYIAPEVFFRNLGGVSHKSDVYSYGMMVLEMVGGRKNIDVEVSQTSEIYFPSWIYKHLDQSKNLNLNEEITGEEEEITRKLIAVSLWCIQTNSLDRPSMTRVIEMLQGSLQSLELPLRPT
uniref:Protein kinase domain-containing protein n=3 Tax=Gossypium raimondii TaxID=29730 RepID=A0A0D2PBE7_GOSRA|nr:hypothetical protein B456_007G183300 [Gossypium raimondii]